MSGITNCSPSLAALRLAEERACAGYLAARKTMVGLAGDVASIGQMVREHPRRADYRTAFAWVSKRHGDAVQRARLAYNRWQRAQLIADSYWTASGTAKAA